MKANTAAQISSPVQAVSFCAKMELSQYNAYAESWHQRR